MTRTGCATTKSVHARSPNRCLAKQAETAPAGSIEGAVVSTNLAASKTLAALLDATTSFRVCLRFVSFWANYLSVILSAAKNPESFSVPSVRCTSRGGSCTTEAKKVKNGRRGSEEPDRDERIG